MLSRRVQSLTPSLTLGISSKAKALKKSGVEVINLSIGEPDFFTPETVKQAGIKAIENNLTKYDAAAGAIDLRAAICQKLARENQLTYAPEQIVVSSGAKYSLTNTLLTITNPGDEVIIPVPYWLSYPEIVRLNGAVPHFVETSFDNNFKLKADELKAAVNDKSKAVIINNPSNPTGAVYTERELREIAEVCLENDIYIIADEIYERICYLDTFTSMASLSEEIKQQTIVVNGMSKSLSMTGWRLGYTATTAEIAKAMSAIQGHLVSHPCTISQYAAIAGLQSCADDIAQMKAVYQKRRDRAVELIAETPDLSIVQPDGAFYIFINVGQYRDKIDGESLSLRICNEMLDEHSVALVPGIAFGDDSFIRMSYAAKLEDIEEGLLRLKRYLTGF